MADEKDTTAAVDPSIWDEAVAVTGRPNDEAGPNSTFAERAKARKPAAKATESGEPAPVKAAAKKAASRKK